ncbi:MAG: hypothetical protein IIC53_10860 [Proteobacteria bacterium]|nr:hypothetical protein [Pseudomonadota bacterium]
MAVNLRCDVKRPYWPPPQVSEQGKPLHDKILKRLGEKLPSGGTVAATSEGGILWRVHWCIGTLCERGLPDSSADILAWGGNKWRYATDIDRKRKMDGEPLTIVSPEIYCQLRFGMGSEEWRFARFVRLGEQVCLKGDEFAAMELGEGLYEYFTVQGVYQPNIEYGARMKEGRNKPKYSALARLVDDALGALGKRASAKDVLHLIQKNHDDKVIQEIEDKVIQEIEDDPAGPIIHWRARNGREMKTAFKRFQSLVSERRKKV